ncbi:hypothetical protein C8J56DRAFT_1054325 [Mycena floridula]|nr:hypothetical protein C8J56DRAFT_1054325 [Mycena floridula]
MTSLLYGGASFHPSSVPVKTSLTVSTPLNVIKLESGIVEGSTPENLKPVLTTNASVICAEIQRMISLNEPCCKKYNVKEEDYETICETTTQAHPTIRIHSNNKYNLILVFMPGVVHEVASRSVQDCIQFALRKLGFRPGKYLHSCGSTSVMLNHPHKAQKMPDESWKKVNTEVPCVVLEVSLSETISQLRSDMRWWFTNPEVKLVILIDITSASQASTIVKKPKILIEEWFNIPDSEAWHPNPQPYKIYDLTDLIPDDMKIEISLWAFFESPFPHGLKDGLHLILDKDDLEEIQSQITVMKGYRINMEEKAFSSYFSYINVFV